MAKTFFEIEPDLIGAVGDERFRQYSFTYYEPGKGDQIGAYSVLVTSPARFKDTWHATKFYRASKAAYQVVSKRELTPREIELFEQRLRGHNQARLPCAQARSNSATSSTKIVAACPSGRL